MNIKLSKSFIACLLSFSALFGQQGFPFIQPSEKPSGELSEASKRNFEAYLAPRPSQNELCSQFKYTDLKGFDHHNHDGTISRRDPSKVVKHKGKYYVWYTYRNTPTPPKGAKLSRDLIPSADWGLAEIWSTTSKDGFTWEEQGVQARET